ncbi:MAG: DUF2238 domain-containing protein [Deltaproteobacteria bacterium]|nr:DUF2238 domain-containing protein [Deltaproteobacteria bacterium]
MPPRVDSLNVASSAERMTQNATTSREPVALLLATGLILLWSGIGPHDRITWWLEVSPVLIGALIATLTFSSFRLSPLLYRLLFIHAVILMVGGHYTYARVPPGFWLQDLLDLSRNHYDRLGHLAQGFIPAILAREILIRLSPLEPGKWLFFFVVCACLAFSAFYEMIEWWVALLGGQSAASFLGTQGDIWDTQWDMFFALIGSICAQVFLGRTHDQSLRRLNGSGCTPDV